VTNGPGGRPGGGAGGLAPGPGAGDKNHSQSHGDLHYAARPAAARSNLHQCRAAGGHRRDLRGVRVTEPEPPGPGLVGEGPEFCKWAPRVRPTVGCFCLVLLGNSSGTQPRRPAVSSMTRLWSNPAGFRTCSRCCSKLWLRRVLQRRLTPQRAICTLWQARSRLQRRYRSFP
jgi:hypothetical protein